MDDLEPFRDPMDELDQPPAGRINFRVWLVRFLTWDALIFSAVLLLPVGIGLLFPDKPGAKVTATAFTAGILPPIAFFLRSRVGWRHIASNRCSNLVRGFQFWVLILGLLALMIIDCIVIALPKAALLAASEEDRLAGEILLAIYLSSMAFATYPGREQTADDRKQALA